MWEKSCQAWQLPDSKPTSLPRKYRTMAIAKKKPGRCSFKDLETPLYSFSYISSLLPKARKRFSSNGHITLPGYLTGLLEKMMMNLTLSVSTDKEKLSAIRKMCGFYKFLPQQMTSLCSAWSMYHSKPVRDSNPPRIFNLMWSFCPQIDRPQSSAKWHASDTWSTSGRWKAQKVEPEMCSIGFTDICVLRQKNNVTRIKKYSPRQWKEPLQWTVADHKLCMRKGPQTILGIST